MSFSPGRTSSSKHQMPLGKDMHVGSCKFCSCPSPPSISRMFLIFPNFYPVGYLFIIKICNSRASRWKICTEKAKELPSAPSTSTHSPTRMLSNPYLSVSLEASLILWPLEIEWIIFRDAVKGFGIPQTMKLTVHSNFN